MVDKTWKKHSSVTKQFQTTYLIQPTTNQLQTMKCRHCNSINTRVTATEHHGNESWRYCRCLDCKAHYKTIETYAVLKRGSIPGVKQHPNCHVKGEQVGTAVLTEANILEIRRLAFDNQTYVQIAKRFGIHQNTVYRIVKRKSWTHV